MRSTILIILTLILSAVAQEIGCGPLPVDNLVVDIEPALPSVVTETGHPIAKLDHEFRMAMLLLTWAAVIIGFMSLLLKARVRSRAIMKIFGTTIVVTAAVFVVVVGIEDTGPVMGLLGTVIGYVVGKQQTPDPKGDPDHIEDDHKHGLS